VVLTLTIYRRERGEGAVGLRSASYLHSALNAFSNLQLKPQVIILDTPTELIYENIAHSIPPSVHAVLFYTEDILTRQFFGSCTVHQHIINRQVGHGAQAGFHPLLFNVEIGCVVGSGIGRIHIGRHAADEKVEAGNVLLKEMRNPLPR
jgi:hypothetical protein